MSAGGHLAAMLAVKGEGSLVHGSRVRAAVSWSGPLHLGVTVRLSGFLRPIVARFLGCRVEECGDRLLTASPTSHIDPSDAPILIVNSTREFVPLDQATVTAEAFRRHGVPSIDRAAGQFPRGVRFGRCSRRARKRMGRDCRVPPEMAPFPPCRDGNVTSVRPLAARGKLRWIETTSVPNPRTPFEGAVGSERMRSGATRSRSSLPRLPRRAVAAEM